MQVTQHGRLALLHAEAHAETLEQLSQTVPVVEPPGQVGLLRGLPGRSPFGPPAGPLLVDRAPVGGEDQPAGGVGHLPAFEHDRVQALPGERVAGFEIGLVEPSSGRPHAPGDDPDDPSLKLAKFGLEKPFCAIATDRQRAHRWRV